MAADGTIIIETEIDDKNAQKELKRLEKQIKSLEEQLNAKKQGRLPLEENLNAVNEKLQEARKQLSLLQDEQRAVNAAMQPGSSPEDFVRAYSDKPQVDAALKQQQSEVEAIQKEWDRANQKLSQYDNKISEINGKLSSAKAEAGEVQKQLAAAGPAADKMASATDKAQKSAGRFATRLKGVVSSALIFTVISQALASLRQWLGRVIKTNEEASAAFARLKGALLTLAQPLLNVIIPALTTFVNIVAAIISKIAGLVSALFGTTAEKSAEAAEGLYNETEAIEGVGTAAKKAGKSLASFDEINQLSGSGDENAIGGGGSGSSGAIEPDFSGFDKLEDKLNNILKIVGAIGAALLTWKIASMFTNNLKTIGGLALAAAGAFELVYNWLDAWNNGIDWGNLNGMFLGLAILAAGLAIAFGPVAAGIALVVGGLAMLVVGIKDVIENGFTLENLIAVIGGMLSAGMGISLITGSWIPLLIAGIASVLLALTVFTGHGEELIEGLKEIFSGFIDFFKGVFTGDFALAAKGIEKIFSGLGKVFDAIISGIEDAFNSFLDWLDEKTNGKLSKIIDIAQKWFAEGIANIKQIFGGLMDFLVGVFTGDWDRAWEGIKNIFKGVWNNIISLLEGAVNLIIAGVNWIITQINKLSFTAPDWVPLVGGETIGFNIPLVSEAKLPRLAQGAVIPPNREFLAVLGDQRSGTNIEAPLSTIEQAVENVMGRMGYGGEQTVILQLDRDQLGKVVYKLNRAESRRIGLRLSEV